MTIVNFGEILGSGFETWKKNLSICVPFILSAVISAIVVITVMFLTLFSLFFPLIEELITNPSSMTSSEVFSQIFTTFSENLVFFIAVFVIMAIITGLISSFFTSGAIGMAKEAIVSGSTNLSHMIDYGKRKYLSLFGAMIIVGLIMFIGFLFLIPGILGLSSYVGVSSTGMSNQGIFAIFSLFIGLILMVAYMLVMSIILALVNYSVVLDDLKAVEGFINGVRVFWHNKLNVFLVWLIVLVVSILFGLVAMIPFVGWIVSLILSLVIVIPLTAIWWSKLYLTISKS